MDYIEKIVKLCRQNKIDVILTLLPYPRGAEVLRESCYLSSVANKYGIEYLSWERLRGLVDFDIDCQDPRSHLNASGARKITRFLGQYLRDHYEVPDHRNDPKYVSWYDDYKEYTKFKIDTINNQKSLKNTLMLLSDRNFSYAVYFPNDHLFQNKIIMKLLRNTGADVEQIYSQSPNLILVDNKKKTVSYRKVNENADSTFGTLSVKNVNDGRSFTLNGKESLNIKNGERLEAAILVFDNETGKQVVASKYQSL